MAELVSILIPIYNCREWVGRAVESALEQTWPKCEIIALDDCSTDGSWEVLQRWADRIRIQRAERNGGQNVSRNVLTSKSRGSWLCYLDADDELTPTAVAEKMKFSNAADAVYGTMKVLHFNGDQPVGTRLIEAHNFSDPIAAAFKWEYPNTTSFMFRRSAVVEAGGWNETIKNCTDYDLYFRLLLEGRRVAAAPASVTIYRQWKASQAVYENPIRLGATRLMIMWRSISCLEAQNRATPAIRDAFFNAGLQVVRSIYPRDPAYAIAEHARLRDWNPDARPSVKIFPRGFCEGYRWLGFRGAEMLARATRFLRPRPGKYLFAPQD